MTSKVKILLMGILVVLIIAITGLLILKTKTVSIHTDKGEYLQGEALRLTITNNLGEGICFSSCYPYLLEKKNSKSEWEEYLYIKCEQEDTTKDCLESKKVKFFELLVDGEKGLHKVLIPVCIGCKPGESFKKDRVFYSNKFLIK